jgi:hypothetical protein
LFLTETEVTVVDENEVEGSDKENEQEEQTEPVNVVEQTDEEDSESELNLDNEQFTNDNKTHLTTLSHILSHTLLFC